MLQMLNNLSVEAQTDYTPSIDTVVNLLLISSSFGESMMMVHELNGRNFSSLLYLTAVEVAINCNSMILFFIFNQNIFFQSTKVNLK